MILLLTVFVPTGVLAIISVFAQQRESAFLLTEARENAAIVAQALMSRIENAILAEEGKVRRDANIFCPEEATTVRLSEFISEITKQHTIVSAPIMVTEEGVVLYPPSPFGGVEARIPTRPFSAEWEQEDVELQRRLTEARIRLSRIARGGVDTEEALRDCLEILREIENAELRALARFQIAKLLLSRQDKEAARKELLEVFSAPPDAISEGVPLSAEARLLYLEQKFAAKEEAGRILKEAYANSVEHPEKFANYETFERLLERIDKLISIYEIQMDDDFKRLKMIRESIEETVERIARVQGDFLPIFREYLLAPDNYSQRDCHIRRQVGAKTRTFTYFSLSQRVSVKGKKVRTVFAYALNQSHLEEIIRTITTNPGIQTDMAINFIIGGKVTNTVGDKRNILPELLVSTIETPNPLPPITCEVYSSHIRSMIGWMFGRSLINSCLVSLLIIVSGLGVLVLLRGIRREIEFVKMRSQFISSVTHELKTPLTSIRMLAETIQLGRITEQKRLLEYMEVIAAESERLSRLITNVLDFARLEEGKKEYSFDVVDLREVARQAVAVFAYYVHYAGFTIDFSLPQKPVFVWGDKESLEQVALNLLSNAIKYSGTDKWVKISVLSEEKNGVVEVEDHGIGIPENEIEAIFERFHRSSATAGTHRTGTGIGLSLVKSIVKAHNGIIEVDSELGKGSIFRVLLPLYEEKRDGEGSGSRRRTVNSDGDERQPTNGRLRSGYSD
ncbi:MAG: HAMP domain-containing histidine kinase [Planctomycetota bacterium]|nr:HAMP domain-containing histidine kinase [Planctomycetota bacterium]